MDDSYLPDTQTQEECSQNTQEPTFRTPWGRLSACLPSLLSVDLFESSYTCGRAAYCNIVIEKSQFPCFLNVSKEHFAITKEEDMVYITDLSKNGTFVNSRRVGRHNRNVIQTNDIIALGQPNTRAFIFNCNLNGDDFLPQELKKTYFVSRLLGQGACGEVRFAIHKQTLEKYAIKKIVKGRSSSNLANLNHPKKIQTEIEILKKISHPFIIQMREVLETEKEVFLVLEFMEGGDLSGLIQSLIPLSESQVKFIFYQMLLAIQYLHQHGVTHRDLKPENVLLTGGTTPLIKISDFGLSKMMNEISLMQTMCGTINYAAPEILNPGGTYSRKVDVWSLGVILFCMFSKTLPFAASDREAVAKKILKGRFEFSDKIWKGISGTAKDLIKKMLTINPNQRISVDEILKHPWIEQDIAMQYRVNRLTIDEESSSSCEFTPPAKRPKFTTCA